MGTFGYFLVILSISCTISLALALPNPSREPEDNEESNKPRKSLSNLRLIALNNREPKKESKEDKLGSGTAQNSQRYPGILDDLEAERRSRLESVQKPSSPRYPGILDDLEAARRLRQEPRPFPKGGVGNPYPYPPNTKSKYHSLDRGSQYETRVAPPPSRGQESQFDRAQVSRAPPSGQISELDRQIQLLERLRDQMNRKVAQSQNQRESPNGKQTEHSFQHHLAALPGGLLDGGLDPGHHAGHGINGPALQYGVGALEVNPLGHLGAYPGSLGHLGAYGYGGIEHSSQLYPAGITTPQHALDSLTYDEHLDDGLGHGHGIGAINGHGHGGHSLGLHLSEYAGAGIPGPGGIHSFNPSLYYAQYDPAFYQRLQPFGLNRESISTRYAHGHGGHSHSHTGSGGLEGFGGRPELEHRELGHHGRIGGLLSGIGGYPGGRDPEHELIALEEERARLNEDREEI